MVEFNTPKGMKDYFGPEMILRQSMIDKIGSTYRKWGYQSLSTPAIEKVDTLCAKSGDEIAGQLFKIDQSDLALRFDQTIGLARFAANNQMVKPYKRFVIAPAWRREEPQKGRLREFLQADADIIGSSSMRCEAELLAMASECLKRLGFEEFSILLNNRKILSGIIKILELEDRQGAILRALDKFDKIGSDGVKEELAKAGVQEEKIARLLEILDTGKMDNDKILLLAKKYSEEGADELEQILTLLKNAYLIKDVKVDLGLVRGLGYYTGPIFEIRANKDIGSVAGGGRYDQLCKIYGRDEPAVGISLGIERLFSLKKTSEEQGSYAEVMVICLSEELYDAAVDVAMKLRDAGLRVETDLNIRKMKNQLEYADSNNIQFAVIVGDREAKSKLYGLKNLRTAKQKNGLMINQIIEDIYLFREME